MKKNSIDQPIFLSNYKLHNIINADQSVPPMKRTKISNKQIFPWNIQRVLAGVRPNSGNGIKVGIIDTGVQLNHPDLAANIKGGINILDPKLPPDDDNGHGTHIAGIIAALNNKIGVVGVADAAAIYPIKVLDAHGAGSLLDLIKGIEWGIAKGMQILNISISGGQSTNHALLAAIEIATKKGIIIVASAGNSGTIGNDTVQIPARIKPVIAVAALKSDNTRDKYSAIGKTIDISAPGTQILSTYKKSSYAYLSGTSMAAAHVTGILAIYRKAYPRASVKVLRDLLRYRSKNIGNSTNNIYTGWGMAKIQ